MVVVRLIVFRVLTVVGPRHSNKTIVHKLSICNQYILQFICRQNKNIRLNCTLRYIGYFAFVVVCCDMEDDGTPEYRLAYEQLRQLLRFHPVVLDIHYFDVAGMPHDAVVREVIERFSFAEKTAMDFALSSETKFLAFTVHSPYNMDPLFKPVVAIGPNITTLQEVLESLSPDIELQNITNDPSLSEVLPHLFRTPSRLPRFSSSSSSSSSSSYAAAIQERMREQMPQVVKINLYATNVFLRRVFIKIKVYSQLDENRYTPYYFEQSFDRIPESAPATNWSSDKAYQWLDTLIYSRQLFDNLMHPEQKKNPFFQFKNKHYQYALVARPYEDERDDMQLLRESMPYVLGMSDDPTVLAILQFFSKDVMLQTYNNWNPVEEHEVFYTSMSLNLVAIPQVALPQQMQLVRPTVVAAKPIAKPIRIIEHFSAYMDPCVLSMKVVDSYFDIQRSWVLYSENPTVELQMPLVQMLIKSERDLAKVIREKDWYRIVPKYDRESLLPLRTSKLHTLDDPVIEILRGYRIRPSSYLPRTDAPDVKTPIYELFFMRMTIKFYVRVSIAPSNSVDKSQLDISQLPRRMLQIYMVDESWNKSFLEQVRDAFREPGGALMQVDRPQYNMPAPESFYHSPALFIHFGKTTKGVQVEKRISPSNTKSFNQIMQEFNNNKFCHYRKRVENSLWGEEQAMEIYLAFYYHVVIYPIVELPSAAEVYVTKS